MLIFIEWIDTETSSTTVQNNFIKKVNNISKNRYYIQKKSCRDHKRKCHPELVSGSYPKTSIMPSWQDAETSSA